jgi:hypothetical protein
MQREFITGSNRIAASSAQLMRRAVRAGAASDPAKANNR